MTKALSRLILTLLSAVFIGAAAFTGCAFGGGESADPPSLDAADIIDVGVGDTVFVFEVTGKDKTVSRFNVHTDEETIGAALVGVGLIEGESTEFGLNVKVVNGERADFDADGAYWAFYVDGGYAMSGVDSTLIGAGKVYSFAYTDA